MGLHIRSIVGRRRVCWAWCGTCRTGSSNKYYLGVVVENGDGTYDGICAGGRIGQAPRIYPQVQGGNFEEALLKTMKRCSTKKREYVDEPDYLINVDPSAFSVFPLKPPKAKRSQQGTTYATSFYQNMPPLPVVWPMLAPNSTPQDKLDEMMMDFGEWVAEEKYDGVRLLGHFTPDGLRWTTRNGSTSDPTRPIERTHGLPHLNIHFGSNLDGIVVDGELIEEGETSHGVSGDLNAKDNSRRNDMVVVLYDLLYWAGSDVTESGYKWPWNQRRDRLEWVFREMQKQWTAAGHSLDTFPFRLSPLYYIGKEALLNSVLARGGEGIMLKNIDGTYVQGQRPANTWYKVKKYTEEDVIIVGFTPGKGKYAGQVGAVRFAQYVAKSLCMATGLRPMPAEDVPPGLPRAQAGQIENVYLCEIGQCSGFSNALRWEFTQNGDAYLGRVMKISAMERLESGAFRHPQFKELRVEGDKSPLECIWES